MSKKSYIILMMSLVLCMPGCIHPFEPDTLGEGGLLVVDGSIIKGRDTQVVTISRSSAISEKEYEPVDNCSVKVLDDSGNEYVFREDTLGIYVSDIDDALLNYDTQYKLLFTTPSGDSYESGYQTLLKTAAVDSFYCIEESQYSTFTQRDTRLGLQFYVDLDAPEKDSRYYRWQMEETWEIHARYLITGIYDGDSIELFWPSDELYYCWETKDITGLYTASSTNLSKNIIKEIPLYFISSTSQKMIIKYSATVKQYALNEDAYEYWHQKELELKESGQIYTRQPSVPNSNIMNINRPDEQVLGFFWASSCTEKHVFLKNPFYLYHPEQPPCQMATFYSDLRPGEELKELMYFMLEVFSYMLPDPPFYIIEYPYTNFSFLVTPECADCRLVGGVNQKPDFWE